GGWMTRLGRGRRGPQRQPGRGDYRQNRPPPGHAATRPRVHRYSASRRLRPQAQPATITSEATIMPTARAVNASRPLRALAAKTAWWVSIPSLSVVDRRAKLVAAAPLCADATAAA